MPSIDDACDALAQAVNLGTGLRAKGYADDQVNPPEAQVFTREFDPRLTLGGYTATGPGSTQYLLGVRVFVTRNDARSSQRTLRGYMETTGSTSLIQAVEDETNWPETVSYAQVTNVGQPFEFAMQTPGIGDAIYWAVDFDVEVVW